MKSEVLPHTYIHRSVSRQFPGYVQEVLYTICYLKLQNWLSYILSKASTSRKLARVTVNFAMPFVPDSQLYANSTAAYERTRAKKVVLSPSLLFRSFIPPVDNRRYAVKGGQSPAGAACTD